MSQQHDDDDDLSKAFRSVRETYRGKSPDPNPEATLERTLFLTRSQERKHRLTRWLLVPIAAALVVSTAWAGVTGRLGAFVHTTAEGTHAEHLPKPATASPPSTSPPNDPEPAPAPLGPEPPTEPQPDKASSSVVMARPPASAPAPATAAPSVVPPPAIAAWPAASASDPNAPLFAEAHRIHFTERDPVRAIVAWDRYLAAAPDGRFIPEARYNRAITLVRVGRRDEARRELKVFASGTYGTYRQKESTALLEAIDKDSSL